MAKWLIISVLRGALLDLIVYDCKDFSFFGDIKIMFMTVFAVLGKEYKDESVIEKEKEEVASK